MSTSLHKEDTKIQLKTKISPAEGEGAKSLSEITLDVGEPLVNTNDKTLVIGTATNQKADDSAAIVLGAGKLVVNSAIDSTEDATTALSNGNVHINHIENNKALSSHKISGARSVKVTADNNADITVSADFELSSPAGITKAVNQVPVNLKDVENNSTDVVNIVGTEAVKVYSTVDNEILVSADFTLSSDKSISAADNSVTVELKDENQTSTDTFEIKGGRAVKATSDSSGNITLSADFELYTDKSAEATNGVNVYLKDVENNALDNDSGIDKFNIKGSGATAVTSDENGNIDINTEYSLSATQQTGEDANASDIKLSGDSTPDIVTIKGGDSTGITTDNNIITISDTASHAHSSTTADTSTSNLEYITEVTQSRGQISAKKKTLQGTDENISITTDKDGNTTVKDIAEVKDDAYKDTDSKYVAKVTQTDGKIEYTKHIIVQGDNISVETSEGETTIANTAAYPDTAVDNKYVSTVGQSKGQISVTRRTILETAQSETANNSSTTTSNGNVEVITSTVKPAGDKGIIPKKRKIKGAKGIEVIVGQSTSDITVQHTHTDITAKTKTSQTADETKITNGGTFTISDVKYDAQGHVTGETTATLTAPKYSEGTGISISLNDGKTNEYTITNSASVNSIADDTTDSKDYIVSVTGSNGSVSPTKKVLTAGTGITITTGDGDTDAEKTKLTIGHSNSVTAKTSYSNISTNNAASVNIVSPKYDAQGHITGTVNQKLTVGAASTDGTKLGTVKTGYTDSEDNIKLNVDSDGNAYVTLTETAIASAGGITSVKDSGLVTVSVESDGEITVSDTLPDTIKDKYTTKAVGGIPVNTKISDTTVESLLRTILGISSDPSGFSFTLDSINANLNSTSGTTTARWKITSHGDNTTAYSLNIGGKTSTSSQPTAGTQLSGTIASVPISFTAGAHISSSVSGTATYTSGSLSASASATITNTCYYGANTTTSSNRTSVSGWIIGPIDANNAKLFVKYPKGWGKLTKIEHVNADGAYQADLTTSFGTPSEESLNNGTYYVYQLNLPVTGENYYLKLT